MRIKEETTSTLIVDKSRFICYMKSVFNEDEYKDYLKTIRKKHFDADHVCSALIMGNVKRSNDDGEPSGSAGAPILNVLEKNDLDNVCALVVRYFGGIKLGAGGLIRAYGSATSQALKNAIIVKDQEYKTYELILNYDVANKIDNYLSQNTKVINKTYELNITYKFLTNDEKTLTKIEEYTKGIKPKYVGVSVIEEMV